MYDPDGQRPDVAKRLGNTRRATGRGMRARLSAADRPGQLCQGGEALGVDLSTIPSGRSSQRLPRRSWSGAWPRAGFTGKKLADYLPARAPRRSSSSRRPGTSSTARTGRPTWPGSRSTFRRPCRLVSGVLRGRVRCRCHSVLAQDRRAAGLHRHSRRRHRWRGATKYKAGHKAGVEEVDAQWAAATRSSRRRRPSRPPGPTTQRPSGPRNSRRRRIDRKAVEDAEG
jgi:hypothetical protein